MTEKNSGRRILSWEHTSNDVPVVFHETSLPGLQAMKVRKLFRDRLSSIDLISTDFGHSYGLYTRTLWSLVENGREGVAYEIYSRDAISDDQSPLLALRKALWKENEGRVSDSELRDTAEVHKMMGSLNGEIRFYQVRDSILFEEMIEESFFKVQQCLTEMFPCASAHTSKDNVHLGYCYKGIRIEIADDSGWAFPGLEHVHSHIKSFFEQLSTNPLVDPTSDVRVSWPVASVI